MPKCEYNRFHIVSQSLRERIFKTTPNVYQRYTKTTLKMVPKSSQNGSRIDPKMDPKWVQDLIQNLVQNLVQNLTQNLVQNLVQSKTFKITKNANGISVLFGFGTEKAKKVGLHTKYLSKINQPKYQPKNENA